MQPVPLFPKPANRRRMNPLLADSILAVVLMVFAWAGATIFLRLALQHPSAEAPRVIVETTTLSPLGYVVIAACFLPLALRRRYPVAVTAVVTLAVAAYELLVEPPSSVAIAILVAVYTVGTLYDRRRLFEVTAAVSIVALVPRLIVVNQLAWYAEALRTLAPIIAAAAFGNARRSGRAYIASVHQRALDAERTREEEALRRVDEERLRIARELHDITAHSLSIIAVQSGAAERVVETDPAAARRALQSIRETSRNALDDLRSMLGVLRTAEDGTPLTPAPQLSRLGDLAEAVREAGVSVELQVGDVADVPAVVQSSAYRIVQEALTNVVRHAGATSATVSVQAAEKSLVVEVTDDGRGGAMPTSGGHGIAGMRERVTTLGGEFEAGPLPGGGFQVRASIPFARRQSA